MNCVSSDLIPELSPVLFTVSEWINVREKLLLSISRFEGSHTEEDVVAGLLSGHLHLWIFRNSAVVTNFVQYPRLKELSVFAGGGKLRELEMMEPSFVEFALRNGCKRIRNEGRNGWVRRSKDHPGYRYQNSILIKDL